MRPSDLLFVLENLHFGPKQDALGLLQIDRGVRDFLTTSCAATALEMLERRTNASLLMPRPGNRDCKLLTRHEARRPAVRLLEILVRLLDVDVAGQQIDFRDALILRIDHD